MTKKKKEIKIEKEIERETRKTIEKPTEKYVENRDILSVLDSIINVETNENIHKKKVIEVYQELFKKNYMISIKYNKLYKSIKYYKEREYAIFRIPLNKKVIISSDLIDRLTKLRAIVKGNLVSLLLISNIDNFINSLDKVKCSEIKDYINCEVVDKIALAIEKIEKTEYIRLEIYIKLSDNILIDITKFIRKK